MRPRHTVSHAKSRPCAVVSPADASVLLTALRESLATTFGDHGLGSAFASLQGARLYEVRLSKMLLHALACAYRQHQNERTIYGKLVLTTDGAARLGA